jgi:putative transcriptional regulator
MVVPGLASMQHMGRPPTRPANPGALGANVRRLRTDRGWSQVELAQRSGLSRSTIVAVELGKYKSADMSTAEKIAAAFEVHLQDVAEIHLESGPSGELVDEFLASPWAQAVGPSDDEIEWARSLPQVIWHGARPGPEALAKIILWRRESQRR